MIKEVKGRCPKKTGGPEREALQVELVVAIGAERRGHDEPLFGLFAVSRDEPSEVGLVGRGQIHLVVSRKALTLKLDYNHLTGLRIFQSLAFAHLGLVPKKRTGGCPDELPNHGGPGLPRTR